MDVRDIPSLDMLRSLNRRVAGVQEPHKIL